jgi:hypothetical protein
MVVLIPAVVTSCLMVAFACILNNLFGSRQYPLYWGWSLKRMKKTPPV